MLAVVALGGNALLPARGDQSLARQWQEVGATASHLAALAASGCALVITHGNGPQVGAVLRRSELAAPGVHPLTMDVAVAHTQGGIGYMLARATGDALATIDVRRPVVALVTQTVVDIDDPALAEPTKPIGAVMSEAEARHQEAKRGWSVGRVAHGWRRVVASPRPVAVVELQAVRALLDAGAIVVAGGGGGIPVCRVGDELRGVAAVVDKDLVSSLLAHELGATQLILATNVERLALDYGTPDERPLDRLTISEARRHLDAGQFPPGSMGPKVEAAVEFVAHGNRRAVITSLDRIGAAWRGRAGTEFTADEA